LYPDRRSLLPFETPDSTGAGPRQCATLCDLIDGSPPGSPVPGILQARILEWDAISFSNVWKWKVKVKSLNRVWLLLTPWTAAYQAPPAMGFSRQEYWSGVPLPSLDVGWGDSIMVKCGTWQHIKNQRHHFANKGLYSQSYGFSSSHIWIWESDHKEGWAPKNRRFWTVVLEKTLESPFVNKEIQLLNPKGNQPWTFDLKDWCWSTNTLVTWCEEQSHWKRPWSWERLKAGGKEDNRGWDG